MKFSMIFTFLTLSSLVSSAAQAQSCKDFFKFSDLNLKTIRFEIKNNPLIEPSLEKGFFPEYDKIRPEHFIPALQEAQAKSEAILQEIRQELYPTFENVILKLEDAQRIFDYPVKVFSLYRQSFNTDDIKPITAVFTEAQSQYSSSLSTDAKLFAQIKKVNETAGSLEADQKLLVEKYYKRFVRNGAELSPPEKERIVALDKRVAELGIKFFNNITDYLAHHYIHVKDIQQLAGLPESTIAQMKRAAEARNLEGYVAEMSQPGVLNFIWDKAENEALRKELYFKSGSVGYAKDKFNNEEILREIANLRQERASLLGYPNHAEYVLEDRMLQNLKIVKDFINSLAQAYKPKADAENQSLFEYIREKTGSAELKPWNRSYWIQRYTEEKASFDSNVFRDYLSYENVKRGLFSLVQNMYGIKIVERPDLPRVDPDIEVVEIRGTNDETYGYVVIDIFTRKIKRSGAWMDQVLTSIKKDGKRTPALATLNLNMSKPASGEPHLLFLHEGETFFHEFGHVLHGLLTQARYYSQSGAINVKWDFVEAPSQVMENFFYEPAIMSTFAFHYKTQEPLPQALLEKLKTSQQLFSGNVMVNTLASALLDLAWYDGTALKMTGTTSEIDNAIINQLRSYKIYEDVSTSTSFQHIFSGAYSAGYYSYKWAEVLEADAYSVMKKGGPEAIRRFREFILEVGGSVDPNTAYLNFAGRPATLDAILERDGVTKP